MDKFEVAARGWLPFWTPDTAGGKGTVEEAGISGAREGPLAFRLAALAVAIIKNLNLGANTRQNWSTGSQPSPFDTQSLGFTTIY
jgi:hypothetical protein